MSSLLPSITIYSPFDSPRLQYVLKYALTDRLGIQYKVISNLAQWQAAKGPKVSYSAMAEDIQVLSIYNHGLLEIGQELSEADIQYHFDGTNDYLFYDELSQRCDYFSSIFFMLSRIEEYGEVSRDQMERCIGAESIAARHGFLQIPIVDYWIDELREQLQKVIGLRIEGDQRVVVRPSYDLDLAWAYKNRPLFTNTAGVVKQILKGETASSIQRLAVMTKLKKDPFDQFDRIIQACSHLADAPKLFVLMSTYKGDDDARYPGSKPFKDLIRQLKDDFVVGVHPSIRSTDDNESLTTEINDLSDYLGERPSMSRQHFLKLSIPHTYRQLIDHGIRDDYTMGYHDQLGFRAGTSHPFPWYDVQREESTALIIHPFIAMDVTLKDYLHHTPTTAKDALKNIYMNVKRVGGYWCFIWHNSSFSDHYGWKGWDTVHEYLLHPSEDLGSV